MRTLFEVKADIDNIQREMTRLVIQQSDIDNQLSIYDRRLAFLQQELNTIVTSPA